jgi:hypothetical protein
MNNLERARFFFTHLFHPSLSPLSFTQRTQPSMKTIMVSIVAAATSLLAVSASAQSNPASVAAISAS